MKLSWCHWQYTHTLGSAVLTWEGPSGRNILELIASLAPRHVFCVLFSTLQMSLTVTAPLYLFLLISIVSSLGFLELALSCL